MNEQSIISVVLFFSGWSVFLDGGWDTATFVVSE